MKPQEAAVTSASCKGPVVDEAIWSAWLEKTKARERRTGQRMQMAAGILACILSIAAGVYWMR